MAAHRPVFDPPDNDLAAPFWAAIQAREIRLPKCSNCGSWQWYPDDAGADCPGAELRWEPVAHTGVLHSFSVVHRNFLPDSRTTLPFAVGLVELDGVEGPRLVSTLDRPDGWVVGARVEARFEHDEGGTRLVFTRSG